MQPEFDVPHLQHARSPCRTNTICRKPLDACHASKICCATNAAWAKALPLDVVVEYPVKDMLSLRLITHFNDIYFIFNNCITIFKEVTNWY